MHLRGTPQTMQSTENTTYHDVVRFVDEVCAVCVRLNFVFYVCCLIPRSDVASALRERVRAAEAAGVARWNLIADPGIGFAKNLQDNVRLRECVVCEWLNDRSVCARWQIRLV